METVRIDFSNSKSIHNAVTRATSVLRSGGVILYPTDTLYGLGVDSLNLEAVEKLFALKGRDEQKAVHSVVADLEMANRYAVVTKEAKMMGAHFLPGPLTLILQKRDNVPSEVVQQLNTFGVRIPDSAFCLKLAEEFSGPFTSTSANVSGLVPESNVDAILDQFGDQSSLIDLIIDAGELTPSLPSTVIDLSGETTRILREGVINNREIQDALGKIEK